MSDVMIPPIPSGIGSAATTAGIAAAIAAEVARTNATFVALGDTHVVIDMRAYGIVDGASSPANGAANLAAIRAAIAAAPAGATIQFPVPVTGYYVEQPAAGTCFALPRNINISGADGQASKVKFGPETAGFVIVGFEPAAGTTASFENINIEGPDAPNGKSHIGILHDPTIDGSEGRVLLRRNVRMTKWSYDIKADGDFLGTSNNHVSVGPACFLQTNGLGSCVLHLGGSIFTDDDATFDMVGGTSQEHDLYLEGHVAFDVGGHFLHAGGYNIQCFGGLNYYLDSATANFAVGDVGQVVTVTLAGTNGSTLSTTIAAVSSATRAQLAVPAPNPVYNATVTIATGGGRSVADGSIKAGLRPAYALYRNPDFALATPGTGCMLSNPNGPTIIVAAKSSPFTTGDFLRTQNDTVLIDCVALNSAGHITPLGNVNAHTVTIKGGVIGCQLNNATIGNCEFYADEVIWRPTGALSPINQNVTGSNRTQIRGGVIAGSDGQGGGQTIRVSTGTFRMDKVVVHNNPGDLAFLVVSVGGMGLVESDAATAVAIYKAGAANGVLVTHIAQVISPNRVRFFDTVSQSATACTVVTGRLLTDLGTTNASAVVTSASFTQADVGSYVANTNVPAGTTVLSVSDGVSATLSANATGTASGQSAVVGARRCTDGVVCGAHYTVLFVSGTGTVAEGEGNVYDDDTKAWASDANALGSIQARRAVGANVTAAANLVLGPNSDTFHITGTTTINNIYLQSTTVNNQRLHASRVTLIADALWTTSGAGNVAAITPVVGQAVVVQYDPNTATWYKVA